MFILQFLRWLCGWIRLEAEGGFPERLLNLSARAGVPLWNTGRSGVSLSACCFARKYRKLRPLARKTGMRLRVRERHGLPFFLHRHRARTGILAGIAVYMILLQVFSQQIWVVKINGNERVPDETILKVVEPLGVALGKRVQALDISALQIQALQELPELVWITVNPNGSVVYVETAERQPTPQVNDRTKPSNIKATRAGRILRMDVTSGQAAVRAGDTVVEGMLLVGGVVDTKLGPVLRKSAAVIWAETKRQLTVRVPLKETRILPTGRVIYRPTLRLFWLGIPLYTDGPMQGQYQLTEIPCPLMANGLALPVGMYNRYYHQLAPTEIVRTPAQAQLLAEEQIIEREKVALCDATVTAREVTGGLEEDAYVVTGIYECVEDIGAEEPILLEND